MAFCLKCRKNVGYTLTITEHTVNFRDEIITLPQRNTFCEECGTPIFVEELTNQDIYDCYRRYCEIKLSRDSGWIDERFISTKRDYKDFKKIYNQVVKNYQITNNPFYFSIICLPNHNYTPRDLIIRFIEDSPGAEAHYDEYGKLYLLFGGNQYEYSSWDITKYEDYEMVKVKMTKVVG